MDVPAACQTHVFFHHAERDISVVVHGDDVTAMGTDADLDWYASELQKVFEITIRGRIGEGTEETEVSILNRIVRMTPTGVRYEADPRHHEPLVRSMGLEAGSSVITPGVKTAEPETSMVKGEVFTADCAKHLRIKMETHN